MFNYQKTVLYVYPNLNRFVAGIDDLVQKFAVNSFYDLSPCEVQAEKILQLIESKKLLINLKVTVDEILKNFTSDETLCLEYKYFKRKPKSYFENLDTRGRSYFRKQLRILNKFCKHLNRCGLDENEFKKYLKISFISTAYERVTYLENKYEEKNKKQRGRA